MSTPPPMPDKLEVQSVHFLYRHAPKSVPINVINGSILVAIFWSPSDTAVLLSWFLALLALTFARLAHVRRTQAVGINEQNVRKAKYSFMLGAALSGAIWGAGFILLGVPAGETYRLLYLLVLGGMGSGAFTSMASSTPIYSAYLAPMLLPAIILSMLDGNAIGYASGTMILLYLVMLIATHHSSSHTLADGMRLRFENEGLVKELFSSNAMLVETNQRLRQAQEDLRAVSLTDELTSLSNRRHFSELYETEWARAKRNQTPLSCLMIDIDKFKAYNDHYGHQQGDVCLRSVAQLLKSCVQRPGDLIARYGGEEFVAILADTPLPGAVQVAERMIDQVRTASLTHDMSTDRIVTVSIGVATFHDNLSKKPEDLLKTADDALYKAKHEGRNRMMAGDGR